jgi:hypothetical protein
LEPRRIKSTKKRASHRIKALIGISTFCLGLAEDIHLKAKKFTGVKA